MAEQWTVRVLLAMRKGHFSVAHYQKRGSKWKFLRSDPDLEFLRHCGPDYASHTLSKHGFCWSWLPADQFLPLPSTVKPIVVPRSPGPREYDTRETNKQNSILMPVLSWHHAINRAVRPTRAINRATTEQVLGNFASHLNRKPSDIEPREPQLDLDSSIARLESGVLAPAGSPER